MCQLPPGKLRARIAPKTVIFSNGNFFIFHQPQNRSPTFLHLLRRLYNENRKTVVAFVDVEASVTTCQALSLASPGCDAIVSDDHRAQAIGGTNKTVQVGSGVVWDLRGNIVTNYHVIAKALVGTPSEQARPPKALLCKRQAGPAGYAAGEYSCCRKACCTARDAVLSSGCSL